MSENVIPKSAPGGQRGEERVAAIGKEQIRRAREILSAYKSAKSETDARILENERWLAARRRGRSTDGGGARVCSAWLYNCIENKLADMMDNFPQPNVLPREEGDRAEAARLSQIIPVILDACDFEETYRSVCACKLKHGTGVYGVFWDARRAGGLGDVDVRKVKPTNFFPEPGITDLQASRNLFTVEYIDREALLEEYPFLGEKSADALPADGVNGGRVEVISWYYKKRVNGRTVLHFCRFAGDEVLYATENEVLPCLNAAGEVIAPPPAECGLYDHGLYPFVVDAFIEDEESIWGSGLIDLGKNAQEWIDRGNEALLKSMEVNAKPRFFVRANAEVNKEEFADLGNDIVTFTGSDPAASVMPIQAQPVSSVYLKILQAKITELKETTGNRDVSSGGASSGVTAASAIAAMQEAAGKSSRELNKQSYRAFRRIVHFVIELIRQFYDLPRQFRILGRGAGKAFGEETDGQGYRFVRYTNEALRPVGAERPGYTAYRLPQMDVEVTAQKQSLYSKMSQNEFALQLYNAGFFAPGMKDAALAALEMMDFDRKQFVVDLIAGGRQDGLPAEEKGSTGKLDLSPVGSALLGGSEVGLEKAFMREARRHANEAPTPR